MVGVRNKIMGVWGGSAGGMVLKGLDSYMANHS